MRKTDRKECAESKSFSYGLTQSLSSLMSKGHFYVSIGLPFSKKAIICDDKDLQIISRSLQQIACNNLYKETTHWNI